MQARLSLLIGDPPLDIVFYFEGISFHGKKKKNMKQNVVARSKAEAEIQAMTLTTCELMSKTNRLIAEELKL